MGKPKNLKEVLLDPAGIMREPEKPEKIKPPKMPDLEKIEAEAVAAEREKWKRRRGRAGTILSGGAGVTEEVGILNRQLLG